MRSITVALIADISTRTRIRDVELTCDALILFSRI